MKFRKKPVVIEAFRLGERGKPTPAPEWFGSPAPADITDDGIIIHTLEGDHLARWGDWIIRGVKGELYPIKPDIFAETYHPLSDTHGSAAALEAIAAERIRQIEEEQHTPDHDDRLNTRHELAAGAACYAAHAALPDYLRKERVDLQRIPEAWPRSWFPNWWKPKDRRRDLIRAGALIVAELDRLDREAAKAGEAAA